MLCSLLRLSCQKMGAHPGLDFFAEMALQASSMMTSLKRGSVTADNSTLCIAYRFISNL